MFVRATDVRDEMFAADIGGDHRRADHKPGNGFIAQKITFRGFLSLARDPEPKPNCQHHVSCEHRQIYETERNLPSHKAKQCKVRDSGFGVLSGFVIRISDFSRRIIEGIRQLESALGIAARKVALLVPDIGNDFEALLGNLPADRGFECN